MPSPRTTATESSGRTASASAAADHDSALFRKQESTFVLLNLTVLAAIVLIHFGFRFVLGDPQRLVLAMIALFFIAQTIELFGLLFHPEPFSASTLFLYPRISVAAKLVMGAAIGVLGGIEDSHYAILMVLPIISAAFRFSLRGILVVASLASVLTLCQLWLFYRDQFLVSERQFYEASTDVFFQLMAGLLVGYLARQMRADRDKLQRSLADLEQARDRLVAESKLAAIGRLSGAIAHEIRNPIAMILSAVELTKRQTVSSAEQEEMRDIIVCEAQRLERLTSDFLTYARARAPEKRSTSLIELLTYLVSLGRARADSVGINIRLKCSEDAVLLVDPFQMQQALLNLLLNAIEASAAGDDIIVGVRRDGNSAVVVFVENTGVGIPGETVARLFEPFVSTKESGVGLGLAIARNIARNHGGDLVLGCNADGLVRFDLQLPGSHAPSAALLEVGT
jgi:signal transduction histidine kinase